MKRTINVLDVDVSKEKFAKQYVLDYQENPTKENKEIVWSALYKIALNRIKKRPFFNSDEVEDTALDIVVYAMKRIDKGLPLTNVYGYCDLALTNILYSESSKQKSVECIGFDEWTDNIINTEKDYCTIDDYKYCDTPLLTEYKVA